MWGLLFKCTFAEQRPLQDLRALPVCLGLHPWKAGVKDLKEDICWPLFPCPPPALPVAIILLDGNITIKVFERVGSVVSVGG